MHYIRVCLLALVLTLSACATSPFLTHTPSTAASGSDKVTPVATHGNLSVSGRYIVDQSGSPVSFAGPSFFWSTTGWGQERFYNADAVAFFASDWNASIVRAAIASDRKGSYLTDPEGNMERAITRSGVGAATSQLTAPPQSWPTR